jgi:hypothetical protein
MLLLWSQDAGTPAAKPNQSRGNTKDTLFDAGNTKNTFLMQIVSR